MMVLVEFNLIFSLFHNYITCLISILLLYNISLTSCIITCSIIIIIIILQFIHSYIDFVYYNNINCDNIHHIWPDWCTNDLAVRNWANIPSCEKTLLEKGNINCLRFCFWSSLRTSSSSSTVTVLSSSTGNGPSQSIPKSSQVSYIWKRSSII